MIVCSMGCAVGATDRELEPDVSSFILARFEGPSVLCSFSSDERGGMACMCLGSTKTSVVRKGRCVLLVQRHTGTQKFILKKENIERQAIRTVSRHRIALDRRTTCGPPASPNRPPRTSLTGGKCPVLLTGAFGCAKWRSAGRSS
jgi:hypothetical protein